MTVTCDSGTYVLTGQDVTIERGVPFDIQSYSFTGLDCGFISGRVVTSDAGTYTLTGQDLNFNVDLQFDIQSYSFTGLDCQFISGTVSSVQCDAGVYALTGQDVNFIEGKVLTCDTGSYTLTGNGLNFGLSSPLISGAYTFTGLDCQITSGGVTEQLDAGVFNLNQIEPIIIITQLFNGLDFNLTGLNCTFTQGFNAFEQITGNSTITGTLSKNSALNESLTTASNIANAIEGLSTLSLDGQYESTITPTKEYNSNVL